MTAADWAGYASRAEYEKRPAVRKKLTASFLKAIFRRSISAIDVAYRVMKIPHYPKG
jgi:hypothetical protein